MRESPWGHTVILLFVVSNFNNALSVCFLRRSADHLPNYIDHKLASAEKGDDVPEEQDIPQSNMLVCCALSVGCLRRALFVASCALCSPPHEDKHGNDLPFKLAPHIFSTFSTHFPYTL